MVRTSGAALGVVVVRGMQVALALVVALGLASRNVGVLVNAAGGLAVTFLPAYLERNYRFTLGPLPTLWITVAVLLHAVGMLGLYESVWWWDHLTHALSATVVAGVGYAVTRAVHLHADAIHLPGGWLAVFVLLATLAAGVFWEVLEFVAREAAELVGATPVLIQYGIEDTLTDLVFDAAGAVVVAALGPHVLSGSVERVRRVLAEARRRSN